MSKYLSTRHEMHVWHREQNTHVRRVGNSSLRTVGVLMEISSCSTTL